MSLGFPWALALLIAVPFLPRWRALASAALVLALAQPTYRWQRGRPRAQVRVADGKLELAVQRASAGLPDHARIDLFSDGRETEGSILRAAGELAARDIELWVSTEDAVPPEVGIAALELPALQPGAAFELSAHIEASAPIAVSLVLRENGVSIATREAQLGRGDNVERFTLRAQSGDARYRLELTPHGPDRRRENNSFERRVRVGDQPRVLFLGDAHAEPFVALLRSAGFAVDTRAGPLDDYDFVILSDRPVREIPPLAAYLHDGGGVLFAGGEHSFGPGGYRAIEPLLPVTLEGSDARNEASLALLLAIDKSGSMAGDKLERAKEAALATAALLPDDAYLGVIGFDVEATRIVRLARGKTDLSAIAKLGAGGGTALFPALDAAYADLAGVRAQIKHVVVLTDGQTQEESLGDLVRAMHADGITISTVGLGEDVQRGLLGELAKLARGRAYFTRDPSQIPRLFVEETTRVAHSLVVERALRVKQVAPAAFLRGIPIADAPPLRGMVSTRAKPASAILTADDAPLLARMRVGAGWSLAWTSDLSPRWSAEWFAWPAQGQLFAQLIREHMRPPNTLALETRFVGARLEVQTDVIDARGRFVNGLTGTAQIEGKTVAFSQVAPGRYLASTPARALGSYAIEARLGDRRGHEIALRPFEPEFSPPFEADRALLERAARLTGGGPLKTSTPTEPSANGDSSRPLWPPLLWLALAAFLIDVAVRRLARARSGA